MQSIRPAKRNVPGAFVAAKAIFAGERGSASGLSYDYNSDDLSPVERALRKPATLLERQITAHKIGDQRDRWMGHDQITVGTMMP